MLFVWVAYFMLLMFNVLRLLAKLCLTVTLIIVTCGLASATLQIQPYADNFTSTPLATLQAFLPSVLKTTLYMNVRERSHSLSRRIKGVARGRVCCCFNAQIQKDTR